MALLSSAFKVTNYTALLGWLVLFSIPLWPAQGRTLVLALIVTLLCIAYSYFIFLGKRHDAPDARPRGSFFSLAGVISLFKSPRVVLAGWIHYLAFDLLVGRWETIDAQHRGIPHLAVVPCLFLTFMFGPAGWLAYVTLRAVHARSIATKPFSAPQQPA